MSELIRPELKVTHEKAECFYDSYERKGELTHQTHYCPGCGHGIAMKLLAEAIDELGIRDRVILV
jgi:2-oxoisovalerate ferredoxin oxidoreductase beta subunit